MSRPSDTERGARIALQAADQRLGLTPQRDMFTAKFRRGERSVWISIKQAAEEAIAECQALREACRGG